jgi:hypothetical protein
MYCHGCGSEAGLGDTRRVIDAERGVLCGDCARTVTRTAD